MNRRSFLQSLAAVAGAGAVLPRSLEGALPAATTQASAATPVPLPALMRLPPMARFPEKTDLILITDRPPQLETPLKYFRTDLTPNDAFFVRWHLSGIPTSVDLRTFRLIVGGHVERPMSLSLEQLKKDFEPVSLVAVAQCSGNSRGFFEPRVAGGQWANGAVGNAKWTGVRLRDLLARAGVKPKPVDVAFAGLDRAPMPEVPPYAKSLPFARANDGEVMVAYAMNDRPLPMLNGFPLRLVVPGWFATYWVKSLNEINVLAEKFSGFWMDKAYRIPSNPDAVESPQQLATDTVPITRHTVRSLIVSPEDGATVKPGRSVEIDGVAFDAGEGIAKVEISVDHGVSWIRTSLGKDLGRYSFRRWHATWKPPAAGRYIIMARATNSAGETQVAQPRWNRSGYQRNVIEQVQIEVPLS